MSISTTTDRKAATDTQEIQKHLFGQRTQPFNVTEVNRLFQQPITAEFNLVLFLALESKVLDPDLVLLQIITRLAQASSPARHYLIPFAFCLRAGADANLYVKVPQVGTMHVVGFLYLKLSQQQPALTAVEQSLNQVNQSVLNTLVLLLVAKGTKVSLPIYDQEAGKIKPDAPMDHQVSVIEWLHDQAYETILDQISIGEPGQLQKVVDADSLMILSILLDKPQLASRLYEARDMLLAIKAFSQQSLEKIPIPTAKKDFDYKSLSEAVLYFNYQAYQYLIKHGQFPSYLLINQIISEMRQAKSHNDILVVQQLEKMLLISLELGTELDQDQLTLISALGSDLLSSVNKVYQVPAWRKVCRRFGPDGVDSPEAKPASLTRLAVSLNLDPTLSAVGLCHQMEALAKIDPANLKAAAAHRQQEKMSSKLGHLNEFIDNKSPALVCRNRSLLTQDPFDYNDLDLAYYRDDQGAVWCFPSDMFADLLESGRNPYNSTSLPASFQQELRHKIENLQRFGVPAQLGEIGLAASTMPTTFSASIDSLSAPDKVNEKTSQQLLNTLIQLAANNNLSAQTIKNLTKTQMIEAWRSIGYELSSELSNLSTGHALVTTAHLINQLNQSEPSKVSNFFLSLNQLNL